MRSEVQNSYAWNARVPDPTVKGWQEREQLFQQRIEEATKIPP